MILNQLWKYVTEHRKHIPDHYPFVICDEFICMPNHIHGILVIGDNTFNRDVGTQFIASHNVRWRNVARTYKNMSLQDWIQPKSWSLWSIIRGFKIGITKYARQIDMPFAWQWRYHDRIIRNNHEYERIKYYIQTNPENWSEDRFFNT